MTPVSSYGKRILLFRTLSGKLLKVITAEIRPIRDHDVLDLLPPPPHLIDKYRKI